MTVIDKVLLVMSLPIPYDMAYEIIGFLFHDRILKAKSLKVILNESFNTNVTRYEEFDTNMKWCIWGICFFPHQNLQIQNTNCILCGDFVYYSRSCRCVL